VGEGGGCGAAAEEARVLLPDVVLMGFR